MLSAVALKTWGVVVPEKVKGVDNLVQTMIRIAGSLNMTISPPKQM